MTEQLTKKFTTLDLGKDIGPESPTEILYGSDDPFSQMVFVAKKTRAGKKGGSNKKKRSK